MIKRLFTLLIEDHKMKKIFIIMILLVLIIHISTICYTLWWSFSHHMLAVSSIMLYLGIGFFIVMLIYGILTRKTYIPILLSFYFILCLLATGIEIIYLSAHAIGTKDKMIICLIYFIYFVYVTKSVFIKQYFQCHHKQDN